MSDDRLVYVHQYSVQDLPPSQYDRVVMAQGPTYDIRHFDDETGALAVGAEVRGGFVRVIMGVGAAEQYHSPIAVTTLVLATDPLELPRDQAVYDESVAAQTAHLEALQREAELRDLDEEDREMLSWSDPGDL